MKTCPHSSSFSEIKVQKPPPPGVQKDKWFKIWNKDVAGEHYAHYWLVADMWWTSGDDFQLSVDNIRFFKDHGDEWKMDLKGPPPTAASMSEYRHGDITV